MNLHLQCVCASVLFGMVLISFASSFKAINRYRNFSGRYAKSAQITNSAFEKLESFQLEEYGLSGDWYTHRKTGAEVISIRSLDDNKVFGITFKTPPTDSTGIAHVLEHSVLCGSKHYPVKEPFVELLKGSLQNFLNAFTYPDRTCYPVATTNLKDFYNLADVYLDAVLRPRAVLDPQVLRQEGWHYELEATTDPLTIKGVVYNEMKGVYSSPEALLGRAAQQSLFPDTTYGVDSGGDPRAIPNLTFEQFRDFHAAHYHPSNSRVFFYGDDDPAERLALLDRHLRDFDRAPITSQVHYQPLAKSGPTRGKVRVPFAVGTDSAAAHKHMISVNWLLNDAPLSSRDSLGLGLLDRLLLGTPTAPLRKALIESGLGESVLGGSGLSDELLQATFCAGMKGVAAGDVERVERLITDTLGALATQGFDAEDVRAAVNTLEFRLREFNTGSDPRGLSLMLGMMSHWVYGRHPAEGVRFEEPLRALQRDLEAGKPVFQELLQRFLVGNAHRVSVEMVPEAGLDQREAAEEVARLATIKEAMSPTEVQEVVDATRRLKEAQVAMDSDAARATIPSLALEDLNRYGREIPSDVTDLVSQGFPGARLFSRALPSSGVLYADIALDYAGVEVEDLSLLPLFARMLMETGTARLDETSLTRRIGAHTGGIGVSFHNDLRSAAGKVADSDQALLYLVLRGKALAGELPVLFELFTDILLSARLDNQKRAIELLRESKARREAAVLSSGHSFAATRIAARHSFLGYLNEVTSGLTGLRGAGDLLALAENGWSALQSRLMRMRDAIVTSRGIVVNLTGDRSVLDAAQPSVLRFLQSLPSSAMPASDKPVVQRWRESRGPLLAQNEGFVIPSQVNYVGLGGALLHAGDRVKGSTAVASRFLSNGYLWDQVRVVGGAYGGFGSFSEASGRFSYLSYRDPGVLSTIQAYDRAPAALRESAMSLSAEELLQCVVGAVGDLDGPLSVDQKGFSAMVQLLAGETPADRQQWRNEVLGTTAQDIAEFADHLQRLSDEQHNSSLAVFGTQRDLAAANDGLTPERRMVISNALPASPAMAD